MTALLAFLEPAELAPDAVELGRIADAWGIKGWFKVIPYSASPEALFSSKRWILMPPAPRPGVVAKEPLFTVPQRLQVRVTKEHGGDIVVQADGVDDRDTAERLKGCRIFIARSAFPTPSKDEYYWVDLIGCEVINRDGVALGKVTELLATGPQTVMVTAREVLGKTLETMIPFVDAYVDSVSLENKRITVDWQLDY